MGDHSLQTLYIKNFGCQMNAYDTGRMADLLGESHGLRSVGEPEHADLIIFNTCHIREKAEEKLFSELGRLNKLVNRAAPARKVIFAVGGCVGQAEGDNIFRRAPYVDLVFGPQNYHRLPNMLDELLAGGRHLREESVTTDKFDQLPLPTSTGPVAAVTVQEGCDKFCTYCVVPHTRGREWSRPVNQIIADVAHSTAQGAVEIQLLGQNVNAYAGTNAEGGTDDLAMLIRRVALVDGVQRIRFVTSHPANMSTDLVALFAELPSLCPYLHLPIQSGSDRILAAMRRDHTVDEYLRWIEQLRAACPDIALASDFIVGFPGESDEDFLQTMHLVETVGFDHAYSFCFSPRPGTLAAQLESQVPKAIREARLAVLQERLNAMQWANNIKQVGRVEAVLVEGSAKKGVGMMSGRTAGFRRVNFPGHADWIGRIVAVEITEGLPNSLKGKMLA